MRTPLHTYLLLMAAAPISSCGLNRVPLVTAHTGPPPIKVCAHTYWNDTGITLQKGHHYQFHISGTWIDAIYKANAKGPISPFVNAYMFTFRPFLRYSPFRDRRANYFQAIGTIGRGEGKKLPTHAFIIQDGVPYTAPATGILYVFANDAPWETTYANNKGHLDLTVTTIQTQRPK